MAEEIPVTYECSGPAGMRDGIPRGETEYARDCEKKLDRQIGRLLYPRDRVRLPVLRGECDEGVRPCPFVSCRYNMFLDITPKGGITHNFGCEPWDVPPGVSCALDVAEDFGELSLESVAGVFGMTSERVRQVQETALSRVARDSVGWGE